MMMADGAPPSVPKAAQTELERLRVDHARLERLNRELYAYIRRTTNDLLEVLGTSPLRPEELIDDDLVQFDPIGIVATSFRHVLANLRQTHDELRFAHDELQAVFESVGAALLVLGPRRNIVAANQRARDLFLEQQGEILGRDCRDLICGREPQPASCLHHRIMASQREETLADWTLGARTFSVIGRPLLDARGDVSHVVLAYADVTERRAAEQSLRQALSETREAKERLDGILRSLSDGLLVLDGAGALVLSNRKAEQLLGIPPRKWLGVPFDQWLRHPELVEHLRQVREHGQDAATRDLALVCADNRDCVYQARTSAIRGAAGEVRGTISLLHEVTRERQIERMKSDFVSTAAHELRTPLATILGFSELLLTDPSLSAQNRQEALTLVHEKAERLSQIVDDLLDISRIESGEGLVMNLQPVLLAPLCEEAVHGFRLAAPTHRFELHLPPGEVRLEVDPLAISQVLDNLLGNAVKYSPRGGAITVAACVAGGFCRITVGDQGIGITPEQLERVFDKFYRADASNTAIAGTGLGLTIVKHVIEAHGGEIRIDSAPGEGTTVSFTLPLAAAR